MAKEEMDLIRGFVANIQSLKDAHINDGLPINYGMLCTITTNGWKLIEELKALEQESQTFEWCTGCREYDQEKHCCPRYNKVIRNTVEEMKQPKIGHWIDHSGEGYVECPFCGHATNCEDNIDELHYCFHCGARMVEPQESEE